MKNYRIILMLLCAALLCVGCGKKSRPADLPDDMTPCEVTITQDGAPVENATVTFAYTTDVKYSTSGTTDAKGVAVMMTYGYAGAQQGTAKVLVSKLVTEGASDSEDYAEAGSLGQDFHVIDAKYRSEATTDLEITVGKANVKETFEVGAPVHEAAK